MHKSKPDRAPRARILQLALAVAGSFATACGQPPSEGPPPTTGANEDGVTRVQFALTTVPTGVTCIAITSTMGAQVQEQRFTVTSGAASTMLSMSPLPAGLQSFDAKAYGVACGAVTASTAALWVGYPVSVLLGQGQTVTVNLTLRRVPTASVNVDFCSTQPCGTSSVLGVAGANVREIAVANGRVYFTEGGGVFSVPASGGTVELVTIPAGAMRDGLSADGSGVYWTRLGQDGILNIIRTSVTGPQTDTVLASQDVSGFPQVENGNVYFVNGQRTGIKVVPAAGGTPRNLFTDVTFPTAPPNQILRPYLVDDATAYYLVPGGVGATPAVRTASVSGQLGGALTSGAAGDATFSGLASDGQFLYFGGRFGGMIQLRRIPLGGGPVETLATDTAAIVRIAVDGAAVYWFTLRLNTDGTCQTSTLMARSLASGATPVQLFTSGLGCATDLAADNSFLYLAIGRQIVRIAK